jgi:hypothetical protein
MLVVRRMPLTLLTASDAGDYACLHDRAYDGEIGFGLPHHDAAGRIADVGAVETESNAAGQVLHIGLAEIGVGATRTARVAVVARLDTADDHVAIEAGRPRVRVEDFSNRHVHGTLEHPLSPRRGRLSRHYEAGK